MVKSRSTWESETSSITGERRKKIISRNLDNNWKLNSDYCDPIDGVVVLDEEYTRGRSIYGHLVTVYRYGREEDEVMGIKFSKEMIIGKEQVYPMINSKVRI